VNWLRRNWVDALLVALIVAGVGGLLAVLLRGGFGGSNASTPPTPVTTPNTPPPSSTAITPNPTPPTTSSTARNPTPQRPTPSTTAPRVVTRAQPAQASSEPGNYSRADFLRNYRIAVGTYSSATRAGAAAARLRGLGFPAQAFSSGKAFIVVVGPYAREASARAAFTKLRQGNPDAVLYSPDGSRERAKTSVAAAPTTPPATPRAAPGGPGGTPMKLDQGVAYLQVGAFKDTKSALPLLERLKSAGFKALLRAAADGFTRVLVGPYSPNALSSAKASLSDQGLNPFTVKE
jgi:cell division septation protein DedD